MRRCRAAWHAAGRRTARTAPRHRHTRSRARAAPPRPGRMHTFRCPPRRSALAVSSPPSRPPSAGSLDRHAYYHGAMATPARLPAAPPADTHLYLKPIGLVRGEAAASLLADGRARPLAGGPFAFTGAEVGLRADDG